MVKITCFGPLSGGRTADRARVSGVVESSLLLHDVCKPCSMRREVHAPCECGLKFLDLGQWQLFGTYMVFAILARMTLFSLIADGDDASHPSNFNDLTIKYFLASRPHFFRMSDGRLTGPFELLSLLDFHLQSVSLSWEMNSGFLPANDLILHTEYRTWTLNAILLVGNFKMLKSKSTWYQISLQTIIERLNISLNIGLCGIS